MTVTHELKTVALQQVMAEHKWDALITGIRRDEDPTRAKERYFSPRTKDFEWDYKDQPPEFWNQFTTCCAAGEHVRVQALLDWTERDIWLYIQREGIPIPKMYFARTGTGRKPLPLPLARLLADLRSGRKRRGHDRQDHRRTRDTPRPANAPAARRITTSATRCRSCARKDSCKPRSHCIQRQLVDRIPNCPTATRSPHRRNYRRSRPSAIRAAAAIA